jgi:two-component system sensor histidine kinase BaeS
LVAIHRRDGGWDRLAADKRMWVHALLGAVSDEGHDQRWADFDPDAGRAHMGPGGHRGPPPWAHRALRDQTGDIVSERGAWPPRGMLARLQAGDPPRPLELRLMLLDASEHIIYGRADLLDGAERRPLRDGDTSIGTLALLPGPSITELSDLRFRERQTLALWLIALGVSLLAALLAFPLSKRLTRPVAAFQRTMRRLAAGEYAARVQVQGRDELGRLGRDLNALAQALAQTEQARRQWVADISHELRTPLSLLRADVEALQDGVRPFDQRALKSLHADTLRLGRLIDDLYELSMTDLGALSYRKAALDLYALLADELDAFREPFADAGLRLRLEPPTTAADWTLQGDAQRLSQLFRNLLRNSLAYTDAGGELRVSLARAGASIRIDFDDTAPGVPEEALPHLFERLYRVEASRSRATGGAGLGLAIAHNIVAAHGGEVHAAASPLGGLRVRITLPAAPDPAASGAQPGATAPKSRQRRKPSGGTEA